VGVAAPSSAASSTRRAYTRGSGRSWAREGPATSATPCITTISREAPAAVQIPTLAYMDRMYDHSGGELYSHCNEGAKGGLSYQGPRKCNAQIKLEARLVELSEEGKE